MQQHGRVALSKWPNYEEDERAAVARVLQSGRVNYWTGEEGRQFEQEFADFVGARHGVAVANGTVALELALHATGLRAGDEVIVPARTFVATAMAVCMRGGVPVFADVDADSQNVTVETLAAAVTPRTRALIAVHLAGWPCDMPAILEFARERGLLVIEDCAQAHGAEVAGRRVGSFGDAAAFSFCQDKILSTGGEGGLLTTGRRSVCRAAWAFKDHGKGEAPVETPAGERRRTYESIGTNWRMTEMQAAIGRVQLAKLPAWLARRQSLAATLAMRCARWDALRVPLPAQRRDHAGYRLFVFVRRARLASGWHRDRLIAKLRSCGVACDAGGPGEIYREPVFAKSGLGPRERLPVAWRLGETSIAFPLHPTLTDEDLDRICTALDDVMHRCRLP